jgi:hypothetical protein
MIRKKDKKEGPERRETREHKTEPCQLGAVMLSNMALQTGIWGQEPWERGNGRQLLAVSPAASQRPQCGSTLRMEDVLPQLCTAPQFDHPGL